MKVSFTTTNLPFKHPFTISKGTKTHQPALVVQLEHLGHFGYGEAPAIAYYNLPVDKMISDLTARKVMVEKFSFTEPGRYWHYLHHLFPQNGFLVCALDMAAWDLYAKMRRKPLYACWATGLEPMPLTDYTIGIDTVEKMVEKMQEKPWPIYKVKLGTDNDVAIMEGLRRHTDAVFRIDANAGWTVDEALQKIKIFSQLGVEFIEQPLAKDDWEGMKQLYAESPLPLIADESCVYEQDVAKCEGHFHGINIKLTKCTGITPALRMITDARQRNMKVMLGSMNESSIGSAAIVHLMPLVDYVDVDGPLLLEEDVASGLQFDFGKVELPQLPGLGISTQLFG